MNTMKNIEIWNFGRTVTIPTSRGGVELSHSAGLVTEDKSFAAEFVGYPGISVKSLGMGDITREELRQQCDDRSIPYDVKDSKLTLVAKWISSFLKLPVEEII